LTRNILYLFALGGVVLVGASLRISNLSAVSGWHDYDEGVYLTGALLINKGYVPYKDFFFAHPPLIPHILSTIVGVGGPHAYTAARTLSAIIASVTLVILASAAHLTLGRVAAIAGTAYLALDGYAAYNSRMVMLEPYTDFFSSGAILTYSLVSRSKTIRQEVILVMGTGLLIGLAISSKMTGIFAAIAILFHSLKFRGARVTLLTFITTLITYFTVSARYLLLDPELYFKQVILFHVVRPNDGVPLEERVPWMLTSIFDAGVIWGGIPALVASLYTLPSLARSKRLPRESYVWIMWSLAYLIAFLLTKTFYGHYIQHLITPLSYVAATPIEVALRLKHPPWYRSAIYQFFRMVLAIWIVSTLVVQAAAISIIYPPNNKDEAPLIVAERLNTLIEGNVRIFAFEPIYTFLIGIYPHNLVIDTYGYMMFEGMNLSNETFVSALWKYIHGSLYNSWPIYNQAVQYQIIRDSLKSDFVILDWRAKWQLTRDSLSSIYAKSRCQIVIREIEICRILR